MASTRVVVYPRYTMVRLADGLDEGGELCGVGHRLWAWEVLLSGLDLGVALLVSLDDSLGLHGGDHIEVALQVGEAAHAVQGLELVSYHAFATVLVGEPLIMAVLAEVALGTVTSEGRVGALLVCGLAVASLVV
jgi:hypothetical protein